MRSHRPNNKSDFLMGAQGQVRQQGHHEQSLFLRWNQQLMYFFVEYLTTYVFVPHNTTLCVVLCYTNTFVLCNVYNYVHISCHNVCLWHLCIGWIPVTIGWGWQRHQIAQWSRTQFGLRTIHEHMMLLSRFCWMQKIQISQTGMRKSRALPVKLMMLSGADKSSRRNSQRQIWRHSYRNRLLQPPSSTKKVFWCRS